MASLTVNAPGASLDGSAQPEQRTEVQGSWPPHGSSGAAPSAPASSAPPVASGGSAPLLAVSALPAEARRRFDALLAGEELPDQRPPRPLGSALAAALAGAPRASQRAPPLRGCSRRNSRARSERAVDGEGVAARARRRFCAAFSRRAQCGPLKVAARALFAPKLTRGARGGLHCVQREVSMGRTAPARARSCAARPRLSRARRRCSRCARRARAGAPKRGAAAGGRLS